MKIGNEFYDGDFFVCHVRNGEIIAWGDGIENFNSQELFEFLGGEVSLDEINKTLNADAKQKIEDETSWTY